MNYRMQVDTSFSAIEDHRWQEVWSASAVPTPFTHKAFLSAAEVSGSACADTGWRPCPISISSANGQLQAIAPLYVKDHSYGEYVFDWAWARAYQDAGLAYFPKWLIASPFSPVPGSRLLASSPESHLALARGLTKLVSDSGLSSAHLLFGSPSDHQVLNELGWLTRTGVQFHWFNRGYRDFEDFLSSLSQPKRKKIKAERRKVASAGITCQVRTGPDLSEEDWTQFYRFYENTYLAHGNPPYFTLEFFRQISGALSDHLVMATAHEGGDMSRPAVAASLLFLQQTPDGLVAYGRYWGAGKEVSMLHFEMAYYTPIQWAIENKVSRLEGGAQGEHKMARGFEPVVTQSSHWISEPRFRDAVERFLARESNGVDQYVSELSDRLPFKG